MTDSPCPCGSGLAYHDCCGPYHHGEALAPTAEALMRSRYSAFVKQQIDYLRDTTWPLEQKNFDVPGYHARASQSLWLGLTIHEVAGGMSDDTRGTVSFTARSMVNGMIDEQSEKSLFRKKAGRWYYVKALQ